MEDTLVVIMLKDEKTGFFERELGAFNLEEYEQYLVNIYGIEDNENITLYMTVSLEKELLDWEFNAILDYYDIENISNLQYVINMEEVEDSYNPTWIIKLEYKEDIHLMRDELIEILKRHKSELDEVLEVIKDKEEEYLD